MTYCILIINEVVDIHHLKLHYLTLHHLTPPHSSSSSLFLLTPPPHSSTLHHLHHTPPHSTTLHHTPPPPPHSTTSTTLHHLHHTPPHSTTLHHLHHLHHTPPLPPPQKRGSNGTYITTVTALKRKGMKDFCVDACTNLEHYGEFWEKMKPLLPSKGNSKSKIVLFENDRVINNSLEVAEVFNKYFCDTAVCDRNR